MKRSANLLTLVAALGLVGSMMLLGCEKKGGEGALERAGKAADEAAEQATTQAQEAAEELGDAVEDALDE